MSNFLAYLFYSIFGRRCSSQDEDVEPKVVEPHKISEEKETEVQPNQALDENQDEDSDPLCSICYVSLFEGEILVTTCGHVFHKECILTAFQQSKTCPNCRTRLRRRNSTRQVFIE